MFPESIIVQLYDENCVPVKCDYFAAAYDLSVCNIDNFEGDAVRDEWFINSGQTVAMDCGFRFVLPENLFAWIVPRSSWRKKGLVCNAIFDPGFLDPVLPFVTNASREAIRVVKYDRVLQCIFLPRVKDLLVTVRKPTELPFYNRGGGVGSTGK